MTAHVTCNIENRILFFLTVCGTIHETGHALVKVSLSERGLNLVQDVRYQTTRHRDATATSNTTGLVKRTTARLFKLCQITSTFSSIFFKKTKALSFREIPLHICSCVTFLITQV